MQEIAELNLHHDRFEEGMTACQELIGLIRGLISGHEAFRESVVDMQSSQTKYSLAVLDIDVPDGSVRYAQHFDELAKLLDTSLSQHPKELAKRFDSLVNDVFTEEAIQSYFETMGQELSRQADDQW
jgi:hypothetical protein